MIRLLMVMASRPYSPFALARLLSATCIFIIFFVVPTSAFCTECYKTSIRAPTPFTGNSGEIFKTADGEIWKVLSEYNHLHKHHPEALICPRENVIIVSGKKISIQRISGQTPATDQIQSTIESQIDGSFNGWTGETIVSLINGQIWQQASYNYTYSHSFMPSVLIYNDNGRYMMKVGSLDPTHVTRLK